MKKGIIGFGGFGREVFWSLTPLERINTVFFVNDEYWDNSNEKVLPLSSFKSDEYEVIVAIGDPVLRMKMVDNLPKNTKFFTHIHHTAQILGDDVTIGHGSIICAGTILTTNIVLGRHSHLNLHTTIGHDCRIDDFFTTAPSVNISGNCNIGKCVYFGTNSSVKQKITITNNVTIGMNSSVTKNINDSGVYIGTPSKKM